MTYSHRLMPHLDDDDPEVPQPIVQLVERAIAKAKEVLLTVGLSHKENAFPDELSGGERRRPPSLSYLGMPRRHFRKALSNWSGVSSQADAGPW